MRTHQDLAEL
ncbi:unnamed protein product [Acanthoscelides obtectus]|uniref:Uncharacterized protein n=1 Tax=Acanthoscelides obtectus TaxID=200917 RepID=A0A9P0PTW6_ACAOB|nr:unnamed protein product [Acanthoscelides obtectus]